MSEKRREIDPIFKQIIIDLLAPLPVIVETEVEVSRLPRTIDVIVKAETAEAEHRLRTETPFHHFVAHNQIEFKGLNDRLTPQNYAHILGRTHLYLGDRNLTFDGMSVTIICARRPRNVLESVLRPHIFTNKGDGLYQNDGYPQVNIVVINELPQTEAYTPLLLFASSEKTFEEVMRELLSEKLSDEMSIYVLYALEIRPDMAERIVKEMTTTSTIFEENLKVLAEGLGDRLIQWVKPEDRVAGLTIEERLSGLTLEEIRVASEQAIERALWQMIYEAGTFEERRNIIREMSIEDRSIIFREEDGERFIEGLDVEDETIYLRAWLDMKKSQETKGNLPYAE